jgi:hypothetical protein
MKYEWLNNGEPNENGEYIAVIENLNGARVSTFKGSTYKEVADKILQSQVAANREINRLKRPPDQAPKPLKVEPRTLTPSDNMRLADDITNPEKIVSVVNEIVNATSGVSLQTVGKKLSDMSQTEQDAFYREEAEAFRRMYPAYYNCDQNKDALFDELKANGWDLTRNNLAIAYQTLMDREELIPWPEKEEEEETPAPSNGVTNTIQLSSPPPRPRSIATGIRNSDASATAPPPPKKAKVTHADIALMSRSEYNQRLQTDPDFRKQVDALGA